MLYCFRISPVFRVLLTGYLVANTSVAYARNCNQTSALQEFAESDIAPEGASCSTYLTQSAGKGISCYWTFPFRDAAAVSFADSAWRDLTLCHSGEEAAADALVNHPDSYDLRAIDAEEATYSVAIKDKGGLQKTLVFIKYEQHRN